MNGINKEIDSSKTAREEGSPPPAVVLSAQVEVAEEDGRLRARDDEDQVDDGEETEHVVELVRPNAVENEEELNENATERQNSAHDDARQWLSVEILWWNLARYLVCSYWLLDRLFLEAKVGTSEDQRCADAKPESQESDQGTEGHGSRAFVDPENKIENEDQREYHSVKSKNDH